MLDFMGQYSFIPSMPPYKMLCSTTPPRSRADKEKLCNGIQQVTKAWSGVVLEVCARVVSCPQRVRFCRWDILD